MSPRRETGFNRPINRNRKLARPSQAVRDRDAAQLARGLQARLRAEFYERNPAEKAA